MKSPGDTSQGLRVGSEGCQGQTWGPVPTLVTKHPLPHPWGPCPHARLPRGVSAGGASRCGLRAVPSPSDSPRPRASAPASLGLGFSVCTTGANDSACCPGPQTSLSLGESNRVRCHTARGSGWDGLARCGQRRRRNSRGRLPECTQAGPPGASPTPTGAPAAQRGLLGHGFLGCPQDGAMRRAGEAP